MTYEVFRHNKEIREILVSALTAVSVGIIIYQLVYNPTNSIEDILIVVLAYIDYNFIYRHR